MPSRRQFIHTTGVLTAGALLAGSCKSGSERVSNVGIQLYTFRDEMMKDAAGTLKRIASLGIKQIESAGSEKGHYYGMAPKEMKKICEDLGMTLRSGHVRLDDKWQQTVAEAVESGQEYMICSSMSTSGQTVDNYKRVAAQFNKAGEDCKKQGIKFGYHNHSSEFESADGQVLYDVLLANTEKDLVHMELDLGWVIAAGKDPLDYFKRYEGRFPLWHLKDMDLQQKHSTEFGKGGLDVIAMLKHRKQSGLKYFFVEQEEYASSPFESMKANMEYLEKLNL